MKNKGEKFIKDGFAIPVEGGKNVACLITNLIGAATAGKCLGFGLEGEAHT